MSDNGHRVSEFATRPSSRRNPTVRLPLAVDLLLGRPGCHVWGDDRRDRVYRG